MFADDSPPEKIVRNVITACADCDICRFLMEDTCLVFPEIYRLYDRQASTGLAASDTELRRLVDLCTYCALCPCPNIRADILKAKTGFIQREGLSRQAALLADVPRLGRVCAAAPRLVNALFGPGPASGWIKQIAGIAPDRCLPQMPAQTFDTWVKGRGLNVKPRSGGRKVAYFAGCTARYLFPRVAKAFVALLEQNGVAVYFPPQDCCGMPLMLEGDQAATLGRVKATIKSLTTALNDGDDVVCSCPTCGYLFKSLIREGAYYSEAYQAKVKADADQIVVPAGESRIEAGDGMVRLQKSIYKEMFKDDGYFGGIDPLQRIALSEAVADAGQYLLDLHRRDELTIGPEPVAGRVLYFAPCHQREQKIGQPYLELLKLVPGLTVETLPPNLYCCGMGGLMGFKTEFHDHSQALGAGLMARIEQLSPDAIVTDCLSCRLQFTHMLPYPVFHPLEILCRSYGKATSGLESETEL